MGKCITNLCQKLPQEITLDLTSRTSQLRTSSVDMLLLILRISQLVVVLTSQHRSLFLTTPVKFAMVIRLFWIATLLTSLANLTKSRRRLIDVLVNQLKATQNSSNLEMPVLLNYSKQAHVRRSLLRLPSSWTFCCP